MAKRILVVGGVAGGASFAARMRRLDEQAEIIMFDKGDYISFANCGLPYYIGETIKDRGELIIQTPQSFKSRFNVDVRIRSEVVAVNTEAKTVTVRHDTRTYDERYDYLVLAPGSRPIRPPLPGIDNPAILSLRTVGDTDAIKQRVDSQRVKRAVVIGGGFIGLEMAENLRQRGVEVTIVELAAQVFAPADPEMANILHQHLILNGVKLVLGRGVSAFSEAPAGGVEAVLDNGARLPADLVILAIGVTPDTEFLKKSGIGLNPRGAITIDDRMRTTAPDVYAVGDAVEVVDFVSCTRVSVPLAGPANRQGRIAADNIAGIDSTYKNTQGTSVCKVFDLTAATTGLSEKSARRYGIEYVKSYTHSASHAGYYPGAFPLSMKILFAPKTGLLLGAQIVGKDGVDKRIDVLATALRHRCTVHDLSELELAYAPPYGSAKDAVNIAGSVAGNILDDRMPVFYVEDVASVRPDTQQLLDVRSRGEHTQGAIANSLLIPVDELRQRLSELDKSKEIMVYCQIGLRGHLATRILAQNGFAVRNLSGGYKTWQSSQTVDYDAAYLTSAGRSSATTPDTDIAASERTGVGAAPR